MQKILLLEDDRNLNRGDFIKIRKRRISGVFRLFCERGGRTF